MKLLPKELEQTLPKLYSTKNTPANEKVLKIKFFTPDANWSWYVSEYDKDEKIFFGFVDGNYPEWGYFSLYELESTKGPLGLNIERDLHFKPTLFKDLQKELKNGSN